MEFNVCSSKNDLYFTYQIFNAFSKFSFLILGSFLVIWSKSIEASNLGLFVKYLFTIAIWWKWHSWIGISLKALFKPLFPSKITPITSNPFSLTNSKSCL